MTACDETQELISACLDGEAAVEERERMERHLAACPACRRQQAVLRGLKQAVGAMGSPEMPASLGWALRAEAARRRPQAGWRKGLWLPAGAAAACAGALLLFRLQGEPEDSVPVELLLSAHSRYAQSVPLAPQGAPQTAMTPWIEEDADDQ